jgi:hypothetical protein
LVVTITGPVVAVTPVTVCVELALAHAENRKSAAASISNPRQCRRTASTLLPIA